MLNKYFNLSLKVFVTHTLPKRILEYDYNNVWLVILLKSNKLLI